MKTKYIILVITTLLLTSCDKEIGSKNGGKNTPATAVAVQINSVKLNTYPPYDGNTTWDITDDGPDIYFKIVNSSGRTLYTSSVKENISYKPEINLAYYNIYYTINNLNERYTIEFYDRDGALDTDDYMGGYYWTPLIENNNHSGTLRFFSNSSDLSFTLYVTWYDENGNEI